MTLVGAKTFIWHQWDKSAILCIPWAKGMQEFQMRYGFCAERNRFAQSDTDFRGATSL